MAPWCATRSGSKAWAGTLENIALHLTQRSDEPDNIPHAGIMRRHAKWVVIRYKSVRVMRCTYWGSQNGSQHCRVSSRAMPPSPAGHDDDGQHRFRVACDVAIHRCGHLCAPWTLCPANDAGLQVRNADAVNIISTFSKAMREQLHCGRAGLLLNNEMDDFSTPGQPNVYNLPPAKANFIRPGASRPSLLGVVI